MDPQHLFMRGILQALLAVAARLEGMENYLADPTPKRIIPDPVILYAGAYKLNGVLAEYKVLEGNVAQISNQCWRYMPDNPIPVTFILKNNSNLNKDQFSFTYLLIREEVVFSVVTKACCKEGTLFLELLKRDFEKKDGSVDDYGLFLKNCVLKFEPMIKKQLKNHFEFDLHFDQLGRATVVRKLRELSYPGNLALENVRVQPHVLKNIEGLNKLLVYNFHTCFMGYTQLQVAFELFVHLKKKTAAVAEELDSIKIEYETVFESLEGRYRDFGIPTDGLQALVLKLYDYEMRKFYGREVIVDEEIDEIFGDDLYDHFAGDLLRKCSGMKFKMKHGNLLMEKIDTEIPVIGNCIFGLSGTIIVKNLEEMFFLQEAKLAYGNSPNTISVELKFERGDERSLQLARPMALKF